MNREFEVIVKNIEAGTKVNDNEWGAWFDSRMKDLIGKKITIRHHLRWRESDKSNNWFTGEGWTWHRSWLNFSKKILKSLKPKKITLGDDNG